ncbi:MAG: histidinol dehydrogenase [Candidatus Bathyarchaeota archaeon]|nr:MAG: histidinol dehydrogenase [Candidatus Bathyarchaeota archaeon]
MRIEELGEERDRIIERTRLDIEEVRENVQKIINDVKTRGDKAVVEYTRRFDETELSPQEMEVAEAEIQDAYSKISPTLLKAFQHMKKNLERFHKFQLITVGRRIKIESGVILSRIWRPIERVGVYIPGGSYPYPSTALMTIVPACVSGVREIVVCSPPRYEGSIPSSILVACHLAGATRIYRIGGAQGIAAMAYGTESVPKVDKILGPGNIYVTAAKLLIFPEVDIDLPAGPSEVLVIADERADPRLIAADLISQAEHGPAGASPAILVTDSKPLANRVRNELQQMIEESPNRSEIEASLNNYGALLVANDLDSALEFVNEYAPEHLQIMTRKPSKVLDKVINAGTVFLGPFSPVAVGDYATGANHVLPTGGFARTQSGLSVDDFIKVMTVQELSKNGLKQLKETVTTLADTEGLYAHSKAIEARFQEKEKE